MKSRFYKESFFEQKMKIYDGLAFRFGAKIKKCSEANYELKSNDFCLNGKNCFVEQIMWTGRRLTKQKNKIDCPCKGKYSFHCGRKFCTTESIACNAFKSKELKNELKLNETLNFCRNDNTIIGNKVSPYLANTYLNIFRKIY